MESIVYTCKYCRKQGLAKYEPEFVREIEAWKSMLTCNRCGDYLEGFWRYKKLLGRITYTLTVSRLGRKDLELEDTCKRGLTETMKRLTTHCTDFFRIPNYFDPSVAEAMFDEPGKWKTILDTLMKNWQDETERVATIKQPEMV